MHDALIALGGNLGNVADSMNQAVDLLNAHSEIKVTAKSRLYSTQPVGLDAGDPFLNSAITIKTNLQPIELLDVLQQTESKLGRLRTKHWGPRSIDLDLILFDTATLSSQRLTLPHPACFYRRFVLDPACDVAADWIHPAFDKTLNELRDSLRTRPLVVSVTCDDSQRDQLAEIIDPETIQITNSSQRPAHLHLEFTSPFPETTSTPKTVPIPQSENQLEHALQVLIATTDEPKVMGEF